MKRIIAYIIALFMAPKTFLRSRRIVPVVNPVLPPLGRTQENVIDEMQRASIDCQKKNGYRFQDEAKFKSKFKHLTYNERKELKRNGHVNIEV